MATEYGNTKKECSVSKFQRTFSALYEIVDNDPRLNKLTGKQRAAVIELMDEQVTYGENKMYNELKDHLKPIR